MTKTGNTYPPFAVDVLSGRFDAQIDKVRQAFHRAEMSHPSVIFTTENYNKDRGPILHANPAYHVVRPAGGSFKRENTTLLAKSDWVVRDSGTWEINPGGGVNRLKYPGYAVWTLAESRHNGHLVLFIDVHMPAHLTPGSRFYNPMNLTLWFESMRTLGQHITAMEKAHPGLKVMIGGDWNIRQNSPTFLSAIRRYLGAGFTVGNGYMFGNVVSLGFVKNGRGQTIASGGSSDHQYKRLPYRWPHTKGHHAHE